jgi:hypothetical protein
LVTRGGATDDFAVGGGALGIPARRRAVDLPGACVAAPWLLEPDAAAGSAALARALGELPALRAAAAGAAGDVRVRRGWDAAAQAIERLALAAAAAARPLQTATLRG